MNPDQDPQGEDQSPVSIVAPWNTNMDMSTMRFAPDEFQTLLNRALSGQQVAPMNIPAAGTPGPQDTGEFPDTGVIDAHTPIPESQPLMAALDTGIADKKYHKAHDLIREGIQSGDNDMVAQGHEKLMNTILGPRTFGEWYNDTIAGHSQQIGAARRVAGDVVMRELQRATGLGMPRASEAINLGLIHPSELDAQQTQQEFSHLIPQEPMAFNDQGMPISTVQQKFFPAQPGQEPQTAAKPGAFLTPLQHDVVESRQKGLAMGIPTRNQVNQSRADYYEQRAKTDQATREQLLPEKINALKSMNSLRAAQELLANARVDWYKGLPDLKRELMGGTSPFELDALKRVHGSIQKQQPIDKADWLIAERWLRKGSPRFSVDFMGKAFDRMSGKSERGGGPFGWTGLPEPPSTSLTPEDTTEAKAADQDLFHQFGTFLGSLLQGVKDAPTKPDAKSPAMTPAEKAELDALRKKHGR